MAYDVDLADLVREMLAGEPDLIEKKLFGGLGFMIAGHLAVAASGRGGLMLRADPETSDALLADPRVEPFVMHGRGMRGWLHVDLDETVADDDLRAFVDHALAYVRSLPAK